MKILFMGTTDFAVACLESIIEAGYEVVGVCTQPDRPKNRGMKLTAGAVKKFAQDKGLPLIQPDSVRTEQTLNLLREFDADIFVVVAYGRILPLSVLELPSLGCVNVHASLLPKYRGAAPIQWAVLNGEKLTGVSTMYLAEGMDCGDVIDTAALEIGEYESFGSVYERLKPLGAELIVKTLRDIQSGTVTRMAQNETLATDAPPITRVLCPIDWKASPECIVNKIRGLDPKPGATAELGGVTFKLFSPKLTGKTSELPAGSIASQGKDGLEMVCGGGYTLLIEQLQAPGGKRMMSADYLRGHKL